LLPPQLQAEVEMAHAGALPHFLDEIVTRSAAVPGARPGSAVQDLVLSIELGAFLWVWLRDWPRVTASARPFFVVYAMNLLGAALWCALGVYIHLFEPLPTERTNAWLAFLGLGAVTPVLFPLVAVLAFKKESPTLATYLPAGLSGLAFALVVATGADLSFGGRMPMEIALTPWHTADGRSYAGAAHGISFDLLSSYPCWRGDSMFVLSTFFLISNFADILICRRAQVECSEGLRETASRLCFGCNVMLVNCVSILYLIVVFDMSMTRVFDVFHAIQGIVMATSFFSLRNALHAKGDHKSA